MSGGTCGRRCPREDVAERSAALRGWLVTAFIVSLIGSAFLAFVLASRRVRSIQAMSAAAREMAQGDVRQRVAGMPSDELGDLGYSFNKMAGELESRLTTISQERQRLTTVLAGMVEGVIAVDATERVVHCNEAARRILGIRSSDLAGRPVWEVVRTMQVSSALRDAVESGRPAMSEATVARDGGVRTLQLHASPLHGPGPKDPKQRPLGAVVVIHDITDLRSLERVRQDFVANASHELKTPIASIRGIVETIQDDESMSGADRRRFLDRVLVQAVRLQHLVEEMLALSRLEAGDLAAPAEVVDARLPIEEACQVVSPLAREGSVHFSRTFPEEPVRVRAQSEALWRIAMNLLDNAVKYTPEGGDVTLALTVEAGDAVLTVQDTGVGIPEDKRDRVFERFYRIDEGRPRETGGSGLGLAIVKHLARSLGGDVSLQTEPGVGSRFIVRLPLV